MPGAVTGSGNQRSEESSEEGLPTNTEYTGGFFRSRGFYFGIILFILLLIFIFVSPVTIPAAATFVSASAANAELFYIMNIIIAAAISPLSAYVVFRIEKWLLGEPKTQRTLVRNPSIEREQRNVEGVNNDNDDPKPNSPHVVNIEGASAAPEEGIIVVCGDSRQEGSFEPKKDVEVSGSVDVTDDEHLSFSVIPGTGIRAYLVITLGLLDVEENSRVSVAEVKKAYGQRALLWHPDREKVLDKELANETFHLLEKKTEILEFFRQLSRGNVDGSKFARRFNVKRHIDTVLDVYIRRIEALTANTNQILDRVDEKQDRIDEKQDRIDERLDQAETDIAELKATAARLLSKRSDHSNKASTAPLSTESIVSSQVSLPAAVQPISTAPVGVNSDVQTPKSNPIPEAASLPEPAAAPPNIDNPPGSGVVQQSGEGVSDAATTSASDGIPNVPQPVPSEISPSVNGLLGEPGQRRSSVSSTVPTLKGSV